MLRKLILIILSASILFLLALTTWVYQLNSQIKESLANKRFLPPTTFYSAPVFYQQKDLLTPESVLQDFEKRQYRPRDSQQTLQAGDYFYSNNKETCLQFFNNHPLDSGNSSNFAWNTAETNFDIAQIMETSQACLIFRKKTVQEIPTTSNNNDEPEQALFFSQNEIQSIWQNRLPTTRAYLEPQIFAQFLENQPIMQTYTTLGNTPTQCLNAVLAIEDSQFLEHQGVSWTGILRAAISNLLGRHRQGGSTITQQMVKNYFLTSERTLKRKAIEFFMALILESHASKDEIIETYLNIIYMGQNGPFQVRGFGAASQFYFQKYLTDLNLPECALLAAVLNGPGVYDPFRKADKALGRRRLVLERMKELNFISDSEYQQAIQTPLPFQKNELLAETAPYFLHAASKQLKDMGLDLASGDLIGGHVFTSLRTDIQSVAQSTVGQQLAILEKENKKIKSYLEQGHKIESSVLIADNQTGEIISVVGGRNYKMTQFNRAIDGHRQVGSIMKPMVYLTALRLDPAKYLPLTILKDEKITYKYEGQTWTPENYAKKYNGEVPLFYALKNSLNAATAYLGMEIGIPQIIDTTRALGVTSALQSVPSLSLGAFELYPIEVLHIYQSLARMGSSIDTSFVRTVLDAKGKVVYEFKPQSKQALPAEPVAVLASIMKHTTQSGTAKSIANSGLKAIVAGKTGTTSDFKDAWFAGFSKNYTGVIWIGYDNNLPTGLTGGGTAVPIWTQVFKKLEEHRPVEDFDWPKTTSTYKVWTKDPDIKDPAAGDVELEFVKATD